MKTEKVLVKTVDKISEVDYNSKIYSIVSIVSLTLFFYSVWEMKPVIVKITDFLGMTSHLTLTYWTGFILIILSSLKLYNDKRDIRNYVYIIYLIVIGLYLFGVPVFAEENARLAWSYYPTGEVKNLLDTKKIDTMTKYPLLSYRSWPATHFISANIMYVTDIKIESLIKYMTIFWIIFVIFTVFSVGKMFELPNNKSFILSMIMISSFWSFHYYYGPQSVAYLLYISSLLMLISFNKYMKGAIVTLLTFMAVVMTHMVTSIALALSLVSSSKILGNKNRIKFILLIFVILVSWYAYVAPTMFNVGSKELIKQVTNAESFSFVGTGKYQEGDLFTRKVTHYARISYLGIYAVLMATSVYLYITGNIKDKNRQIFKINFYWIIGTLLLIVFKYGEANEIDDRIYIMSLIPMGTILISAFGNKTLMVIALLFISLHIPAHYGTESFDQALTTELKGAEFFATNILSSTERYSYYYSPYIRFYEPKKVHMIWKSFTGIGEADISRLDSVKYIVDSEGTHNFMMYSQGYDPIQKWLKINGNDNLNVFYDNGHFKIYKRKEVNVTSNKK